MREINNMNKCNKYTLKKVVLISWALLQTQIYFKQLGLNVWINRTWKLCW